MADHLAKQAVTAEAQHGFLHLVSSHIRAGHKKIQEEWQQEWVSSTKGKHLKRIDSGPPTKRSLRVYGILTRHQNLSPSPTADGPLLAGATPPEIEIRRQ
ncbi:uncharacterized protein A1O9_13104 [Exophiala aquamarina CBS 119918]|uniref:Uncharacterized protein n=1 Tax=Exophiala aquamarina CBS 119918 TaxID=1182545 RepID=A0A072NUZ4_9EURO|nr:uncharacterized protein A1O9_13104 [Exophiala aquamarina CBS 119918]KEF50848.1 hypothetical protein A1O9_13104 [Exophiala aquamarina CBS 119918]